MIVSTKVKTVGHSAVIKKRIETTRFENLGHAAGYMRKAVRSNIRSSASGKPAPPGGMMRSPTKQIRRSIAYAVNRAKGSFVVGPAYTGAGDIAAVHEFGRLFRGIQYPARPVSGPTFQKHKHKIPGFWRGSFGDVRN